MQVMQNILSIDLIRSLKKQSTQFYLLAGVTTLLLAWLSIGMAPSTWSLLFQVIGQFKTLWAQHGMTAVWTLLILIGQSLLLLAAWLLLIGIVVHEITRFQTLQPVSAPPTPLQPANIPATVLAPPPPSQVEATVLAPPPPPARPIPEAVQAGFVPTQASVDQIKPPAAQRAGIDELPTIVASPEPVQEMFRPSSAQPAQANQSAYRAEMSAQLSSLSSSDAQRSSDPYAATRNFEQEEQLPFPDPEELLVTQPTQNIPPELQPLFQRPKWQKDELASDPFAPHEDILGKSLEEDPLQEAGNRLEKIQQVPPQPVRPPLPVDEEDDVFVFGNPFEGALPDVFEHDEDLKRSLQEQNGKEQNKKSHSTQSETGNVPRVKKKPE